MNRLHLVFLDLMIASDTICTIGRKLKELKPKAYIDNIGKSIKATDFSLKCQLF